MGIIMNHALLWDLFFHAKVGHGNDALLWALFSHAKVGHGNHALLGHALLLGRRAGEVRHALLHALLMPY